MNRQEFWKSEGYTDENIECHLRFERRKAKESRERKKKNNESNKEIIKKIEDDLLGKTFKFKRLNVKITSINPTVDGLGAWIWMNKKFSDGSSGMFREFNYFDEYTKENFLNNLNY